MNNNTSYYHFTNWDINKISLDITYNTDWEFSNYWKRKIELIPENELINKDIEVLFKDLGLDNQVSARINKLLLHGKYTSELLKEYIFEEVRLSINPELPSRKKCMFLFDKKLNPDLFAKKLGFNNTDYKLLEIKLHEDHNKLIKTNLQRLNCNSDIYEGIKLHAIEYWKGYLDIDLNQEILFEGSFKILGVLEF